MREMAVGCVVEGLEERVALSASPLSVSQVFVGDRPALQIRGAAGNDRINIKSNGNELVISNRGKRMELAGTWARIIVHGGAGNDRICVDCAVGIDTVLYGEVGNDTLIGGGGDDTLYGGAGNDALAGRAGDDTIVDVVGNGRDRAVGGDGVDSFWLDSGDIVLDASAAETQGGTMHVVSGFCNAPLAARKAPGAKRLTNMPATRLADPVPDDALLRYKNFGTRPLFASDGPSPDDVEQGSLGDCYLLATLAALTKARPQAIPQLVTDLGDGTYAVQFFRQGRPSFVRVDADLPVLPTGEPAYANLGREGSLWVAVYEKAYAIFRRNANSYASLNGGWLDEANSAMGLASTDRGSFTTAAALLGWIRQEQLAGHTLTLGTYEANGAPVLPRHGYSVDAVIADAGGVPVGLRLRNPWGEDGVANSSPDDGYVTLTGAQALASYWMVVSGG